MATNPYEGLSDEALERCVKRMAKTLASKPRNPKMRGYLVSLNGREQKTAQQIEADLMAQAKAAREAEAESLIEKELKAIASSAKAVPDRPYVRKQRVSPIALNKKRTASPRHPLKHCRKPSRYHHFEAKAVERREPRAWYFVREMRIKLHEAQGGICGICGKPLDPEPAKGSLDHVIPRSRVPRETGNYVLTHGECNGDKTNDVPTGCEMVFLLMVNAKLGYHPQVF